MPDPGGIHARLRLVIVGVVFVLAGVAGLGALAALYSPFQPAVAVVSPFIVVGVLASVGLSSLLVALPASEGGAGLRPESSSELYALIGAVAIGIALLALTVAVILPGPPGPSGSAAANVWGYATATDCTSFPALATLVIHYINMGNADAANVVAHYTLYALSSPSQSFSGTASIGTVAGKADGSVTQSVSIGCAPYGFGTDVSFTWS